MDKKKKTKRILSVTLLIIAIISMLLGIIRMRKLRVKTPALTAEDLETGIPVEDRDKHFSEIRKNSKADILNKQEFLVRKSFELVNKGVYKQGASHPVRKELVEARIPASIPDDIKLDSSSFMNILLYMGEATAEYKDRTTADYINDFKDASFSHENTKDAWEKLPVGTLLIKNKDNSEDNDIVMFIGCYKEKGESEPTPHFVECSSSGKKKSAIKITNNGEEKAAYELAKDPFSAADSLIPTGKPVGLQ